MLSKKIKLKNAFLWSFVDQYLVQILKFIIGIFIARILTPNDYGIFGIVSIFIGLGNIIIESGFQTSLINKQNATIDDFSTVFCFNIILSIILYIILFVASSHIQNFFKIKDLSLIIKLTSLGLIINGLSLVHQTLLLKEINFKLLAKINGLSSFLSSLLGITLAINNFSYWSLIIMYLSEAFLKGILLIVSVPIKIKIKFNITTFLDLYKFGGKVFINGFLDTIFNYIYNPLIAKFFSIYELGLYNRSKTIYDALIKQTILSFGKVIFPYLSFLKGNRSEFQIKFNQILIISVYFIFPLISILLLIINPFVNLFLTKKWYDIILLSKLFFIQGFFYSIYYFIINLFYGMGKPGYTLLCETLKKVLMSFNILTIIYGNVVFLMIYFIFIELIILIIAFLILLKKEYFTMPFTMIIKIFLLCLFIFIIISYLDSKVFNFSDHIKLIITPILFITIYILMTISLIKDVLINLKEFLTS